MPNATIMAGIPATNAALFHRIRFRVGDPVVFIEIDGHATLILRDIEMQRAKQHALVDDVACPADFTPSSGLSGDRETATAQAAAEFLKRQSVNVVTADRSLPLIFADIIEEAGIDVRCDLDMGVLHRRAKDEQEIQWLQEAQATTEQAIRMACEQIASADVNGDGQLIHEGELLTSERVRAAIDVFLLGKGYATVPSIIAGGAQGADCHHFGNGPLYTEQPIIVDIFPTCRATGYNGDCTRTVVHGKISERLQKMHAAVAAAKSAGQAATCAGVTGESVHQAVIDKIVEHGFSVGLPADSAPADYCAMTHGTGHGIGLEVHEPPLLDLKGPELVVGDALTIEPGLYSNSIGGIRIEDMVVVTTDGCRSLNQLPESLDWN